MTGGRIRYQPALDGLRALAVSAVILYHLDYGWAKGGFLGVDAFFVLSGFLITSLLLAERHADQRIDLVAFWGRRARRLLPALFALLLAVMIAGAYWTPPWQLAELRGDAIASLFYVANWRFIIQDQSYFALFTAPSPLQHLWSLAIEEQFYLVWPLALVGVLAVGRGSRRVLAGFTVAGIAVSQICMALLYDPANPSRAYYGTESRIQTLLLGCLLAIVLTARPTLPDRFRRVLPAAGVLALGACFVAWMTAQATWRFFYGGDLLFACIVVVLIVSAIQPGSPVRRALGIRPLVYVGTISYGLYLWHWPVIVYLDASRTGLSGFTLNAFRIAVTVTLTLASYYLLERPVLRGGLSPRILKIAGPALGISLIGVTLWATAGAAPAPRFLGRAGAGPGPCGPASAQERSDARDELAREGKLVTPADARGLRVLVIGDSRACALSTGFEALADREGISVENGTVLGCGVVSDAVARSVFLVPRKWAEHCHDYAEQRQEEAIAPGTPDAILWWSGWETSDLDVDGRTVVFGTPEHDLVLSSRMDAVFDRLSRTGAHVTVLTDPPQAGSTNQADASKRRHLDDLYRAFAARHPGQVSIIDLADKLCADRVPCPTKVGDVTPRPQDGWHLGPTGAAWAARWMMPQLVATAPAHRP